MADFVAALWRTNAFQPSNVPLAEDLPLVRLRG